MHRYLVRVWISKKRGEFEDVQIMSSMGNAWILKEAVDAVRTNSSLASSICLYGQILAENENKVGDKFINAPQLVS